MAIYKLGEIGELKYSKSFVANGNDSDFPIFATGGIVGYTKIPTFESNSIILPRVGTMSIYFTNKKHSTKNTAFSFKTKDDTTTKYIYYLMSSIDFSIFSIGSAVPRLTSNFWNQYFINLPPLEEQQKIIDIIEPIEKLIDSINFAKKKTISLISKMGELSLLASKNIESIKFDKQKEKYIESGNYVSTGNIGDFNNLIEKFEQLSSNPTRARLKFKKDTLYISKLDGEKKILYLNKDRDLVLSNGMWGIEGNEDSKYSLYAFLLSNTFYEEKTLKSTGTTMRGLNDNTLKQIINYYSITKKHNWLVKKYFVYLSFLTELLEVFYKIKNKFIKFFVV
ncbi:restriction endonuclease subunit S [Mesoplasma whartonense]|uniref:restriction endonuclease subunit S n=1 Tax=Mesoplasma whartonense TaxID=2878854 RepID=UPI002022AC89|nr:MULTISPECIES: restriction endonuclease subunit S [unclassified Mesoplasma]MCL8211412.1 hypothetical protein [Mesoplasma sp. JKS002664]MCL8214749.1 hypothetical protein [Mesoplasma sp. JKS002663]